MKRILVSRFSTYVLFDKYPKNVFLYGILEFNAINNWSYLVLI